MSTASKAPGRSPQILRGVARFLPHLLRVGTLEAPRAGLPPVARGTPPPGLCVHHDGPRGHATQDRAFSSGAGGAYRSAVSGKCSGLRGLRESRRRVDRLEAELRESRRLCWRRMFGG